VKLVKKKDVKLTKFEMEIMDAVWELGKASIREVQENLPEKRRPAYTTVQTIMNRLEEKGALRRVRKIGNAFIFEAIITRKTAYQRLIDDLLSLLGGSIHPLMSHLVESRKLKLEDLKEAEDALEKLESNKTNAIIPAKRSKKPLYNGDKRYKK
jgi:BlaI family transcriptional regulator, penicillinase repressor